MWFLKTTPTEEIKVIQYINSNCCGKMFPQYHFFQVEDHYNPYYYSLQISLKGSIKYYAENDVSEKETEVRDILFA